MIGKLIQQARSWQFNPGILGIWVNPFYLARRALWRGISAYSTMLSGKMLDVGCGTKPYRKLFATDAYIGLEYDTEVARKRGIADAYYDGGRFPFEDQAFDALLCNQVLEHVFTPDAFVSELARVLKPGGRLLLTVPFIWDEHEQPYDFARYTSFGLKALLERNGFRVVAQRRLLDDVSVLFQLFNAYLFKVLESKHLLLKIALRIFIYAPVSVFGALSAVILPRNKDLFLDQLVVAERLAPSAVHSDLT